MKIAISTGGGDAPGLNAVIRAVVLGGLYRGYEVQGIHRGFGGLLEEGHAMPLGRSEVRGIAHLGGTIIGTTNRGNPFRWPERQADGTTREVDRSDELIERFRFGEELDSRSAPHLAHLETCLACREEVGLDRALVRQLRPAPQAPVGGDAPSDGQGGGGMPRARAHEGTRL